MKYNLIADAGSSKIDWALTLPGKEEVNRFSTEGLNALLADDSMLQSLMDSVSANIPENAEIKSVYYYGAGCATPEICDKIAGIISERLDTTEISVTSDLLGAARSLLGNDSGIACILGTGSNSCRYDGNKIISNVPSLGFILGDEGSGAALGKRLVSDAFKGHLPKSVCDSFLTRYGLNLSMILDKVYREKTPNKFLASLVPFIHEHLWNPYIYSMVRKEFENFLNRNVSPYEGARTLPISFTGSIAFHFSDILREAAYNLDFAVGKITRQPLEGLIEYHKNNL